MLLRKPNCTNNFPSKISFIGLPVTKCPAQAVVSTVCIGLSGTVSDEVHTSQWYHAP